MRGRVTLDVVDLEVGTTIVRRFNGPLRWAEVMPTKSGRIIVRHGILPSRCTETQASDGLIPIENQVYAADEAAAAERHARRYACRRT